MTKARNRVFEITVQGRNRPDSKKFIIESAYATTAERRALAMAAEEGFGGARIVMFKALDWRDQLAADQKKILSEAETIKAICGKRIVIVEASCEECSAVGTARGRSESNCNEALRLQGWEQRRTPQGYRWTCPAHSEPRELWQDEIDPEDLA